MIHSHFDMELVEAQGRDIIMIQDKNKGGMSVTEDMLNVIEFIAGLYGIDPADYIIIWKDRADVWDVWDLKNNRYMDIGEYTFDAVVTKYLSLNK